MKTYNSVKGISAEYLIASKNTRKIFTVTLCILLFVTVFPELASTPAYAQRTEEWTKLDDEEKATVRNALKVLEWVLPKEEAQEVVGDASNPASKPKSLRGKLADDKIRSKPITDLDEYMSANHNDFPGNSGGDVYIPFNQLDYARRDFGKLELTELKDLLDDTKLSTAQFRRLVMFAEGLYHEYVHTLQRCLENIRDYDKYKTCKPRLIEIEAYWAGIRFKLDLKVKLLELAKPIWSIEDRKKLDELDKIILEEVDKLKKERTVKVAGGEPIYKTYLGDLPLDSAEKIISNKDDPAIGEIQTGNYLENEPENIDRARQRAKNAANEFDRIEQERYELLSEWERMKEQFKGAMIYPNTGGIIKLESESAYVVIPPGSLQNTTQVEIYRTNATGLILGENALSPVYGLSPSQISLDPAKPARLCIRVTNTALIKNAHIYWWDTYLATFTNVGWQLILDGREVDEQNGLISVAIDRFGCFVVILPQIINPGELVSALDSNGQPETVTPSWAYDWASWKLIFNVYDTLITFDGEHADRYIPQLATEWTIEELPAGTTSPEGLEWRWRYTFKIRESVEWHDPAFGTATPEDVEFSFERAMVQDRDGGPTWMFYEPLLNGATATYINGVEYDLSVAEDVIKVGKMIDHAVESNGTHVWFNIAFSGAYSPLLQILCQAWTSILSKQWINDYVIGELGRPEWNGEWGSYLDWVSFHNPVKSPLDDPSPLMMGTGPFMLEYLDYTAKEWSVVRFVDYWRGWPADFPAVGPARPAGYVDRFVVTWAYDWETRKTMFLNGYVDFCDVPRQYISEIVGKPGIRCISPLPSLAVDVLLFNFDIDPTTPYGPINDYGVFNQNGIPRNFFSNVNIRKAFAHSIDYATFIQQSYQGEAMQPPTAIIPGLPYYDATVQKYTYDLAKAKTYFEAVPDLMNKGFNITLTCNSGNTARMNLCNLIKTAIESISPTFHVTVATVTSSAYVYAMNHGQTTCFVGNWLADYPDAHNFAYAFYYTDGNFAWRANYSDPQMDALIEQGIRTPDGPERAAIYKQIQQLVIDTCPSVALDQGVGRHFERDWVCGWYYNPIYPSGTYAYNLWKWYYVPQASLGAATGPKWSNSLSCDVDYTGIVNIIDISIVAQAFGSSYGPPASPRWCFRADVDNNRIVNIIDIAAVAKHFRAISTPWAHP